MGPTVRAGQGDSHEVRPWIQVKLKSLLGSLQICREFERTCWQPCGRKRTFSDQEKQRPVLGATRKDSKEASVKSSSSREPSSTLQRYQSASGDTLSVSSESMEFIDKGIYYLCEVVKHNEYGVVGSSSKYSYL